MNILFFTQLFYPSLFGGGEYLFFLIAKELVRRGHTVHVIAQRLYGTSEFEQVEGINIHRVGPGITYSGTLPPTILTNLRYLISAVKRGRSIIKENRKGARGIDIIHSNTYVPALSGYLCSKLCDLPHVITFHDVYQASDKKFWKKNWRATQRTNVPFYTSTLSGIVEKVVLRLNPALFHTVSDMSKEDLLNFGVKPDKIIVIPNGIDSSSYQQFITGSGGTDTTSIEQNAVFIGRLVFYKNIQTVIRAFRKVIALFPNAKLIIIGDGPFKEELIKEAGPIKENVIFTQRISHEDKLRRLEKSSFMVFPSLIEGFGIAIIEAFACKKPVLASDIRPMSDIVKDNYSGFLISPFDEEEWANKMIYLFSNIKQQKSMGENAYHEFQRKYEIDTIIREYQKLYQTVINHYRDVIAA
jgi:glycosyltransferase involved in cell wall biosynthesis